jgi:6-pyruvoyltetrahydropterin/6-carboxytetrahydropterin synthase
MYEVGILTNFSAWHMMPGVEGPEGELHEHDYRIEVVAARDELDDKGMVIDIDRLQSALTETIREVEGRDLEAIRPSEVEAVTVEVLAHWTHEQLASKVGSDGTRLAVRVWESSTAFGGYAELLRSS